MSVQVSFWEFTFSSLYTHSYLPSVVSLMIDKRHTELCAVLLSTGQLNVIHLPSGATLFHK